MDTVTTEQAPWTWKAEPLSGALPEWLDVAGALKHSTSQSPQWVEGWQRTANQDVIAITARRAGELGLVLVLEVVHGPLTIARFCGHTHANANFPAMSAAFAAIDPAMLQIEVAKAIRSLRQDIDLVELSRLLDSLDGMRNPFVSSGALQTDIALSLDIRAGFESVLAERSGQRKRKKMRQMNNRMKERGGWTIRTARERDDILAILQCFYHLKSKRLVESGVSDVFGRADVQAFFNDAFTRSALNNDGQFELKVLEVNGIHAAIVGCTVRNNRITAEFGGISDADASLSPGDFLFFHLIEEACTRKLEVFSFGTGDESYKRAWCDVETRQYNVYVPVSLKGRFGTSLQRFKTTAKRAIKANARLFSAIKKIRKSV